MPDTDTPPEDDGDEDRRLGVECHLTERDVDTHEVNMVNAALYLRRPLLVTGRPGTRKSSLAWQIARELRLGRVLRWPITSHTTLKNGQYGYDAIGRAQATAARLAGNTGPPATEQSVGEFIRLGPLGTALLPTKLPRVLLIDELDKSEADLPNDLLGALEDGEFVIDELERIRSRSREVEVFTSDPGRTAVIRDGRVRCREFPLIVITSNGEREFPEAFLRRCLRLEMRDPDANMLAAMVANHVLDERGEHRDRLVAEFVERSATSGGLPADRLLDAVYLATSGAYSESDPTWPHLINALWRRLDHDPVR
ncbi:MAG TPA: MoxR family ATPase [Micromonosporaceae bacterium]|nr:MoxR family ATPase [Micromonosporaceae bacterium]